MKSSRVIALSAISTAFTTIFLVIGNWFPTFSLSGAYMASLFMMIPLAKDTYKGAFLSYFATVILTGVFSGFFTRWDALFPFAVFTGIHPIVNRFFTSKGYVNTVLKKVLFIIIKGIWFIGTLILTHFLFEIYTGEVEFIRKYIVPIMIVGGALVFPAYDFVMTRLQTLTVAIVNKFRL